MPRRNLSHDAMWNELSELRAMPRCGPTVLDKASEVEAAMDMLVPARDVFFIGRNINYPTMLEGALKLKEISYIHAEGFAAGELKHGPLALLDSTTPVVAVALSKDQTYDKMLANISEVAARDSPVLAIGCEDDTELRPGGRSGPDGAMRRPLYSPDAGDGGAAAASPTTSPRRRGCSIDKPKNLAKSVTVE